MTALLDPCAPPSAALRPPAAGELEALCVLSEAMLRDLDPSGSSAASAAEAAELRAHVVEALGGADYWVRVREAPAAGLVGLVEARIERERERDLLWVSALYVAPAWRRQGLGGELLAAALAWGRERGCAEARLSVFGPSPAERLYARLGFEARGDEQRLAL